MSLGVLPVPYGTSFAELEDIPMRLNNSDKGEWFSLSSRLTPVRYRVGIQTNSIEMAYGSGDWDTPTSDDLEVFTGKGISPIKRLSQKIFKWSFLRTNRSEAAVSQVKSFFAANGFQPSLEGTANNSRLSALENFLFITKKGNCELFSSAAAVLLRIAGVPTRLITGFRITKGAVDGVLYIRDADAHAWLEYWIEKEEVGRSWIQHPETILKCLFGIRFKMFTIASRVFGTTMLTITTPDFSWRLVPRDSEKFKRASPGSSQKIDGLLSWIG